MASSVERLGRYANWNGSSVVGRLDVIWALTNLSKHFIMMGVSAMGWYSFSVDAGDFLGSGMMVVA